MLIALVKRLMRDQSAVTAVEYGLIGALISIAAIAGFHALGDSLTDLLLFSDGQVQPVLARFNTP